MIGKYLIVSVLLGFTLFSSHTLMAGPAIQEMVGIMLHLHHNPSDAEKTSLQKIAGDSAASANERAIATALLNMHHSVSSADRENLRKIAADNAAPAADRTVAGILADLNHTASDADKKELEKLQ